MYGTCNFGKQHEELLQTAKHLGRKWYAMVKFCETRFAQTELKIYVNFEYNYNTYRRTWGAVESLETDLPEEGPGAVASTTTQAAEAATSTSPASATATSEAAATTTTTTSATTTTTAGVSTSSAAPSPVEATSAATLAATEPATTAARSSTA